MAKVAHVFPGTMRHHLSWIPEGLEYCFDGHENVFVCVAPPRDKLGCAQESASAFYWSTWRRVTFDLRRINPDLVIMHSAFWPKFWIIALVLSFFFPKLAFVSWGGDLASYRGSGSLLKGWFRDLALARFNAVVFLAEGDKRASSRFRFRGEPHVIPYYCCQYERLPFRRSRDESKISLQVGNDASEINGHLACLSALSNFDLSRIRIFLPMGYGRFDLRYVDRVEKAALSLGAVSVDIRHSLLTRLEFDKLLGSCDVLLLASTRQRALYSIYMFLCSGRAVFMPIGCELYNDLVASGFSVGSLASLESMSVDQVLGYVREVGERNRQAGLSFLGAARIRSLWSTIHPPLGYT